jgi:hypothetical protein
MALHRASLISCVLSFSLLSIQVRHVVSNGCCQKYQSTMHKVNAVHDSMLFVHDGDPNLQKQSVLQHKWSVC